MLNTLRIATWNSNGLIKRLSELEIFLHEEQIDILLISESHFTKSSYIHINGYVCYNALHPAERARGGASIIIKENIDHFEETKIEEEMFQLATVAVKFQGNRQFKVSAIYSPPRHNIKQTQYNDLLKMLGNFFILGGDFNAKNTFWGSRITTTKGRELLQAGNIHKCQFYSGSRPTYWPTNPSVLPDIIDFFIAKGIAKNHVMVQNYEGLSSDHSVVILTISESVIEKASSPVLVNRKTNWILYRNLLNERIKLNVSLKTSFEIEEELDKFIEAIQSSAWDSTQQIKPRNNTKTYPIEIRELVAKKRRARKTWQRERTRENKRIYNRLCCELKRLTKHVQNVTTSTYLKNLSSCKDSNYSLWKATRNLNQPINQIPPIRKDDGTWARSANDKAEMFANHLEGIFQPLPRQTNSECITRAYKHDEIRIKKVTLSELKHVISKDVSSKKSAGYDLISGKIIKKLTEKATKKLLFLINACFRLRYVPLQWKVAEIKMIVKPGKQPTDILSYRPISVLPVVSKVFEKLLLKRLLPILEQRCIIPDYQFGFRKGHSTIEQVHRITDVAEKAIEEKLVCSAVFLDVSQAFDRVWHQGLLYKLHRDLPRQLYEIIKSYLNERHFRVKEENVFSSIKKIAAGVPQGSVLGPVLYLLYTSDLPAIPSATLATFADDTAILATAKTIEEATSKTQNSLSEMSAWIKKWRMRLNESKSVHMYFTNRNINYLPVFLNGVKIPYANTAKYLGMTLDTKIKWKEHVKKKTTEITIKYKQMNWLLGHNSQLSIYNKILLYQQIIKPIWTYGIQLWGCTKRANINIIQKMQNKILRAIVKAPWYVRNEDLHRDLKINTVAEEIRIHANKHAIRLQQHSNLELNSIHSSSNFPRRLHRVLPMDLVT